MDEPTTDLDPAGRAEVFALARRLLDQRGAAVLVAEQETEAALHADRVLLLDHGRIAAAGRPEEVLTRPDLLEAAGVAAPAIVRLLARLGEPPCLDVETAATRLRDRGYQIDEASAQDHGSTLREDGPPLFEIDRLEHAYPNGTLALAGVNLTIRVGEFVALVGANGSGKTTLARHLNGLLRPTGGVVRVAGAATAGMSVTSLARTVGYVFQNPDHQLFAETVAEEVAFGPRNQGVSPEAIRVRVEEALAAVGLQGREGEDPFSLTKGDRQRVAVASVLATRPHALILDEPTTGLDHQERRSLMEQVRGLNQTGHTVVCITHDLEIVAEYAHRVVVLNQGKIVRNGSTREVLSSEAVLEASGLRAPDLVRLGMRLGFPFLTVEEGARLLRQRQGVAG
jgi:energy-coupling factor transport system ATP-binding protein